jgi:hypothetical protein
MLRRLPLLLSSHANRMVACGEYKSQFETSHKIRNGAGKGIGNLVRPATNHGYDDEHASGSQLSSHLCTLDAFVIPYAGVHRSDADH